MIRRFHRFFSETATLESILSPTITQVQDMDQFKGVGSAPFTPDQVKALTEPVDVNDIEIKPDGIIYYPEIKYRRILNKAFQPGGWGMIPRGGFTFTKQTLSCEFALIVNSRFVSCARGEQEVFDLKKLVTSMEGVKSNALMRCCKDLGIASELWDPNFIRSFKQEFAEMIFVRHMVRNTKIAYWRRKGIPVVYPFEEIK